MTLRIFVFTAFVCLVNGQSSCQTPDGVQGECKSIYSCQRLLNMVLMKNKTAQDVDFLKKSQCEHHGNLTSVCCLKKSRDETCNTPEGYVGKCISIHSCPRLINMLKPPVPEESIAYVKKSKCEGNDQYSVCCGAADLEPKLTNDVTIGNCATRVTAFPPDPRTECCGVQDHQPSKLVGYGGEEAEIDEYPWMVMIEYVQKVAIKLLCGGALISGKYALTAGHCVAGRVLELGTPWRVRLGEHDISHEGPDCKVVYNEQDCNEGAIRVEIEKTIPHPQYDPVDSNKRNDIGLIRLKELAPYTDFIRPICLPTLDLALPQNQNRNITAYAVGWGAVSPTQPFSNVKVAVELPFVNHNKCQHAYSLSGRSNNLWKGQLCAGGIIGKDSCKGDSGGPLVYERTYKSFEVIGIVSYGPVPCGSDGIPGVYTNVYEYLVWIRSTIVS